MKKAINVKYIRLPGLLYEFIKKKLSALSRIELLIIDEFLLTPITKRYFRIIGIKI